MIVFCIGTGFIVAVGVGVVLTLGAGSTCFVSIALIRKVGDEKVKSAILIYTQPW